MQLSGVWRISLLQVTVILRYYLFLEQMSLDLGYFWIVGLKDYQSYYLSKGAMRRDARRPPLCENIDRLASSVSSVDDAGKLLLSLHVIWKISKFLKNFRASRILETKRPKISPKNGPKMEAEASRRPRKGLPKRPGRLPRGSPRALGSQMEADTRK